MKSLACNLSALTFLFASVHGSADVIYSGFQNITIPTTYAGTYIDVDDMTFSTSPITTPGWDFNPFMGGVYLSNNPASQPARAATGGMDTVLNFTAGSTISATGLNFASGSGGSMDHLGTQFTTGGGVADEYLGFKLGSNYGWMRVVFTNNTAGAKVLDWAYDTSGAAITTGNVLQSPAVNNAQTVTLNSAFGSFTLGSTISNSSVGGVNVNSVIKTGTGTADLTGHNTYSGSTTVSEGRLLVNGSITGGGTVSVAPGATLGGSGSIAGPLNVSGVLSPGTSLAGFASGAVAMTTGSTFLYEATDDSSAGADLMVANGSLSLTEVTLDVANANLDLSTWLVGAKLTLISYHGSITSGFTGYADDTVYTGGIFGSNQWQFNYNDTSHGNNFTGDIPLDATSFVTFTVVPEPHTALLGGLGFLALLRRRRL
jgi:autotransporter-associated beta strand protein